METEPMTGPGTLDTQPMRIADVTGGAAARREPVPDQTDIDRERGVVEHQSAAASQPERDTAPLFEQSALENFRTSWRAIQTGFVDNPGGAVKEADELVAAVMQRLAEVFADERANLEQAWAKGGDVSTEDLRLALRRYRAFLDRLLSL